MTRVGILGGGQLARMLAQAGRALDMEFMFLCQDEHACAAPFGKHLHARFDDEAAAQQLLDWADVVTYEFENIPLPLVKRIEQEGTLLPSSIALEVARDRLNEKQRFRSLGVVTAEFETVDNQDELLEAVSKIGFPSILKTRTQGYDGKGQVMLDESTDLSQAWEQVGRVPCLLEAKVPFEREVSIIAARNRQGEMAFYPLSENYHREGILRLSISLRDDPVQAQAEAAIKSVMDDLQYVGVLALELFQVGDQLLANEMAPRVHNTGHWTIEGSETSQFENHLRAVSGMPLGSTALATPSAMVNLVGLLPAESEITSIGHAIPHYYDKAVRPGRKVGHVTLTDLDCNGAMQSSELATLLTMAGEAELASRTFRC